MLNKPIIKFNKINLTLKLDPNFVTGLTEAEGSFSVFVYKNDRAKFKNNARLRYKITML